MHNIDNLFPPERPSPGESPVVPPEPRDFRVNDLVWGPAHGFPSWPGKLVRGSGERAEGKVWVCWFGTRDLSEVEGHRLKTLSEGLEAHHRERKKSRRWENKNLKESEHRNLIHLVQKYINPLFFRIMGHVANLFPLNINFHFQGTQDEHKPRESDPGGDGRT